MSFDVSLVKFRKAKDAVKIHTLMNHQGNIPEFILPVSLERGDGKLHDVNALALFSGNGLIPSPGAYYVMDRGYLDITRLYELDQAKAYFVTRAKGNFNFKRRYSHTVDLSTGVQCDQTVVLETYYSHQGYPQPLRRIRYFDDNLGKQFVFLTSDFDLPATTITALYKSRWQIEFYCRREIVRCAALEDIRMEGQRKMIKARPTIARYLSGRLKPTVEPDLNSFIIY